MITKSPRSILPFDCAAGIVAAMLLGTAVSTAFAAASLTPLGDLPGGDFASDARGVSGDGSVVVGFSSSENSQNSPLGYEAFRWTSGGGMVGLSGPSGTSAESAATGISADGSVVVGSSYTNFASHAFGSGSEAFRWTSSGGMVGLGDLPGGSFESEASGVSADGSVIVGDGSTALGYEAFRWTSGGGMERLWDVLVANGVNPAAAGWTNLALATAISADGNTIVGTGFRNGNTEAFVAVIPTIVPEPAAGALALLGVNSILLLRRRSLRRPIHSVRRPRFEALEDRCLLSLTAAVNYPVGIEPQAVVAGDFNNDGRLDVATANHGGDSVSVLLGNGQGGFEAAVDFPTGAGPNCMAVGDFNNDGKPDLVTGSETTGKVSVLLGNGSGGFAAPIHSEVDPLSVQPLSIAVGDLGQNGTMDLLVGARYHDPSGEFDDTGVVAVLVGNNTGSFFWGASYGTGVGMPTDIAAVDLNGDSILDIVSTWDADAFAIVVFIRPVNDWFPDFYGTAAHPQALALGDFTSDGKLDVITAGDTIDVLSGNGQGAFGASINQPVGGGPFTSVAAGDFNGDGKLDIAAASPGSNEVSVLRGRGDGTFSPAENFAVGSGGTAATNGDINADGRVDAADYVVWRKNGGTPNQYNDWRANFGQSASPRTDPRPVALVTGDFNGDGRLDVATANANANSVSVLFNDQLWSVLPPGVSVSDATVTEGNSGTVNATFTVTLSAAAAVDVTVHYETVDGTATGGSDYVAASGNVVIPAGQTSRTFTVAVLSDRVVEPTETFAVNLSAPVNATVADGQGLGTILDNEPRISINDAARSEGKGNKTTLFTFTVTLSAAYDQPVTMSYQTVNGTATTADNDYIAKTGTLTFNPGETTKTITIEVKADNKKEADETFYLDLFDNSINSLFARFRGIGTIWNDD